MAKRDKPALPDWHLWAEVAQTVSPLHRTLMRERLKLAQEPLPIPKGPPAPRHKPIKVPAPMPSYQAIDFLRRAEPNSAARPDRFQAMVGIAGKPVAARNEQREDGDDRRAAPDPACCRVVRR